MAFEGREHRRFVRANFPCKIIIYTPTQHTIFTHTENIGGGGVRVVIEEKLSISDKVGLEIYIYEDKEPIICKGRVVWVLEKECSYRKNLLFYDTGIEFYDIKEEDRNKLKEVVERIVFGKK